ncbi:MAG: LamG domain-containing protein [Planctomycetes bacterium]|nr:LamG domain-containing protein [Planctomycetota bacterium]
MAWLGTWAKRRKVTIDNTNIDSDLTHFPVPIVLGTSVGQSSQDVSDIFDDLEFLDVDDDFTGTNGDPPNTDLWAHTDQSTATGETDLTIQSNKLNYSGTGTGGASVAALGSTYKLTGDFDIQIDFDVTTAGVPTTSSNRLASLYIAESPGAVPGLYAGLIRYSSSTQDRYAYTGSSSSFTGAGSTDSTGKLRLTRTGSVIKGYTWSGSQWEWDGDTDGHTFTEAFTSDVHVTMYFRKYDGVDTDSDVDNFTVNSGTVKWPENANPNRKKIAITKADGTTQIYGDTELWDDYGERAVVHVAKSDLDILSVSTTELYFYFDPSQSDNDTYISLSGDTAAQSVWDSNFKGVWHMAQDPDGDVTDAIKDSTSNGNDGTPGGTMVSADLIDGPIGKAIDFDGTDDKITITGESFNYDILTLEGYAKTTYSGNVEKYIASNVQSGGYGINREEVSSDDKFRNTMHISGSYHSVVSNDAITTTVYYNVAGRYDQVTENLFVDGVKQTDSYSNTAAVTDSAVDFCLGCNAPSSGYWQGPVAEVRISNTDRSDAWLKATHYGLVDDLITYTATETIPTDPVLPAAEMTMAGSMDDPVMAIIENMTPAEMTMSASMDDPFIAVIIDMTPAEMTMIARVGVVEPANMTPAEMTMSASMDIPIISHVANMIPAEMVMSASITGAVIFSTNLADVYYIFTLTGDADSQTDIEIPMSSFQTRMRSGDPTFLSVVLPDGDQAAAINLRPNGTLKVDMAYQLDGVFIQRETIVSSDFDAIRVDEGSASEPITLSGYATETFPGAARTLTDSIYRKTQDGKITHRLAKPNIYLRPGDTVTIGSDTFVADLITYFISVNAQTMEVSEA